MQKEKLDREGYFRMGRRPEVGFPFAEIYMLPDAESAPEHWEPMEQEELSNSVAWDDRYFRHWVDAFILTGGALPPAAWVIVVFDAAGFISACVEYRPVLRDGVLMDVSYEDTWDRWVARRHWHVPGPDSCHEPPCCYQGVTVLRPRGGRLPCQSLPK